MGLGASGKGSHSRFLGAHLTQWLSLNPYGGQPISQTAMMGATVFSRRTQNVSKHQPAMRADPAPERSVTVTGNNGSELSTRARSNANLRPWLPGQSGNPTGRPSRYNEAIRLYREASPQAAKRLIELMNDVDGRVAAVAAQAVWEKAWGKREPPPIDPTPQLRLDLKRLTVEELRLLLKAVERGAIGLPADQEAEAERVIEGLATN